MVLAALEVQMEKSNSCKDGVTPCRCGRPSTVGGLCDACAKCAGSKQAADQGSVQTEDDRIAQVMVEFK